MVKRIEDKYSETELRKVLNSIDSEVPKPFEAQKLPNDRKDLIIKLVTLRIERLISTLK